MCGIVGMIARKQFGFNHSNLKMFEELLLIDQLRGDDSTGVFGIDRDRNVSIAKVASHPNHLFACDGWGKFRSQAVSNGRILIGHNRAATKGEVTTDNAHPFHENNIVLVHNGTLRDDFKKKHADREVDSHAICAAFNEKGAEEVLPTINGAFAFVWWDIAKGTLFVCRNDERPLNMIVTDDVILMASEPWMAQAVSARNHNKVEKIVEFEQGHLYELGKGMEFSSKKLNFTAHNSGTAMGTGRGTVKEPTPTTTTTPATAKSESTPALLSGPEGDYPKHIDSLPHTTGPYAKGENILVRFKDGVIHKSPNSGKQFIRWTGKTYEPGRPVADVIGWMPYIEGHSQMSRFTGVPLLARVIRSSNSTCGPSVMVHQMEVAGMVQIHNTSIAIREWAHVLMHCKCNECEASLHDLEAETTSVKTLPNGEYKVTCPDCIEDKLEGEYKHEFQQRRYRALQIGEPECNQPAGCAAPSTKVEGPTTLQ